MLIEYEGIFYMTDQRLAYQYVVNPPSHISFSRIEHIVPIAISHLVGVKPSESIHKAVIQQM